MRPAGDGRIVRDDNDRRPVGVQAIEQGHNLLVVRRSADICANASRAVHHPRVEVLVLRLQELNELDRAQPCQPVVFPLREADHDRSPGLAGRPDRGDRVANLRRAVTERFGPSPDPRRGEEVARAAEEVLRQRGYLRASVQPRLDLRHDPDEATLVLVVRAGERTRIGAVDVQGDAAMPTAEEQLATWAEQVAVTSQGDYELALLGWRADTLDPNDFLTALLDSGSIGTTNRARYRSAAMDGLLKRARQDSAPGSRSALYRQAQELVQVDMPFVPLYHSAVFTAYRRELRGLVIGPTGILRYDKAWKQP